MVRDLGLHSSFEVVLSQVNVTSQSNYVDPKSERAILLDLMHVTNVTVIANSAPQTVPGLPVNPWV